jgi:hypothetical protein
MSARIVGLSSRELAAAALPPSGEARNCKQLYAAMYARPMTLRCSNPVTLRPFRLPCRWPGSICRQAGTLIVDRRVDGQLQASFRFLSVAAKAGAVVYRP